MRWSKWPHSGLSVSLQLLNVALTYSLDADLIWQQHRLGQVNFLRSQLDEKKLPLETIFCFAMSGGDPKSMVLKYLHNQNRPYSANDILLNLHKVGL